MQVYLSIFGESFFQNLIVVVTHWSMDTRSVDNRKKKNITQESFQKSWIETLLKKINTPISNKAGYVLPFVFIDNDVGDDEVERITFEAAKYSIFEKLATMPVYACEQVDASVEIRERIRKKAAYKV